MKIHSRIFVFIFVVIFTNLIAGEKRAITFEDFFSLKRIKKIRISPDGQYIACEISVPDIDANKIKADIFIFNLSSKKLLPFTEFSLYFPFFVGLAKTGPEPRYRPNH